ncbi:MAG: hypothetical protein NC037_06560 [Bacteroides sp.]|nr:hypothetical protein [Bacillota bacterium]MCM1393524.1 hypothetical protein [[Eubacterium] siraeum]MCM1456166.1 hypothetical protein [Bacteroides sp.]
MRVQELQRAHYKAQIQETLNRETQGEQYFHDEIIKTRIDEVVSALALGCSLQRPRMFRNRLMTAEDFRRIAEHITWEQIGVAVDARIKKAEAVSNPTWYILGILARF